MYMYLQQSDIIINYINLSLILLNFEIIFTKSNHNLYYYLLFWIYFEFIIYLLFIIYYLTFIIYYLHIKTHKSVLI